MNLTIERASALAALGRVTSVVPNKSTIDILMNIVLTADEKGLSLRGSDLEMEIIEIFEAGVSEKGSTTLPAGKFHDIVRNSEVGANLLLNQPESAARAEVKSGRSRFNVPTLPASDYPKFPTEDFDAGFTMPAKLLADMLTRVAGGVAASNQFTVLTCVYLTTTADQIHAVGGSAFGIRLRREAKPEGADISAILPMKLVGQLTKLLGAYDGDVKVASARPNPGRPASLFRVEFGDTTLTSKLFDAPGFYDYLSPLIEEHEAYARTDQDALTAAVRRVMVMQEQQARSVRLSFSEGGLRLAASNAYGDGEDEIACDYVGPDWSFLLNADRLLDIVGHLRGDVVELGFAIHEDPADPNTFRVIIRAPSDTSYTTIVTVPRA